MRDVLLVEENSTARIGVPQRLQAAQLMTGANRLFSVPTVMTRDKESNGLCCHFSVSVAVHHPWYRGRE
jgi:hypothetical protein